MIDYLLENGHCCNGQSFDLQAQVNQYRLSRFYNVRLFKIIQQYKILFLRNINYIFHEKEILNMPQNMLNNFKAEQESVVEKFQMAIRWGTDRKVQFY